MSIIVGSQQHQYAGLYTTHRRCSRHCCDAALRSPLAHGTIAKSMKCDSAAPYAHCARSEPSPPGVSPTSRCWSVGSWTCMLASAGTMAVRGF